MESFASYKTNLASKNPNLISTLGSSSFLPVNTSNSSKTEKYKSSYDFLMSKSQSESHLQVHHQHQITTHHQHQLHNQKQNHSMSMQIKNEHISPNFLKMNQTPLSDPSLNSANSTNNNTSNNNNNSIHPQMPTLIPKPSTWSSHMCSFQSSLTSSSSSSSSSSESLSTESSNKKGTPSNSQQLTSYSHQFL